MFAIAMNNNVVVVVVVVVVVAVCWLVGVLVASMFAYLSLGVTWTW
jgi:hypothetical protein